ncbi:family 20 glycosylhydrolase [Leifsonia shinshuensis]|uniref:beta-N-acetylhexosaminidase n=2 Tax=Leifsonia shinshuensis TaxID=150026 RepID=A0A7G6YBH6_9MICO|nr:family 20 glycosylhydrolase [Leifsonia shinshuensis]
MQMSSTTTLPTVVPAVAAVIPAVASAVAGDGTIRVASGDLIAGPAELATVLLRFADDLATDARIGLRLETEAGPHVDAAATIVVGFADHDLDDVAPAAGLRADGADPADADERYGIETADGRVRVWARTTEGAHRALTTLRQQLVALSADGAADLPAGRVVDGPLFAWRGLSLDVGRTFHDIETIERVIDMCSLYKLNVLHLHLTEDAGWRFEVPGWPLLAEVGGAGALGGRPGGHYSPADLAALGRYAADRFVTLVPEVDLPGHTQAAFRSYPELAPASAPEAEAAASLGVAIGTLDLDRGPTRRFVQDALAAAAEQFPASAYLHIGGDEAFGMPDADHAAFVDFAVATVRELGRRAIGWQEVARADVGPDEVVQYWVEPREMAAMMESEAFSSMIPAEVLPLLTETMRKSFDDIPAATAKGARVLVSVGRHLYLDRPHPEPTGDDAQEALRSRVGLPMVPPASLRDGVEWDPLEVTPGIDSLEALAGVEAAVWGETVTGRDDLEFLLLPRLAGVGERAWSAAPTEWDEYAGRLAHGPRVWDRRGWTWYRPGSIDWAD